MGTSSDNSSSFEGSSVFWTTQNSSFSSVSFLSDSGKSTQRNALSDLKLLLDILLDNGIPGPHLLRVEKEFNLCTGEGGEGIVYEASEDFVRNLASISGLDDRVSGYRLDRSAKTWKCCVIKRLRSDGDRNLAFQVYSAHTEIKLLSKKSLREHPHIVRLLGWALCLDAQESPSMTIPRLPLLILEKAQFDLKSFLNSAKYDDTSHEDLCMICLDIGHGLEALHKENISHGDMKPTNVLMFDQSLHKKGSHPSPSRWLPKLCDFGLATTIREKGQPLNKQRYKGTAGWKPPESYLETPPESLQLCDIFAYGLVTWCVFVRVPSSPITTKADQDEDSSTIRANTGQQTFYQRASQSIRTVYGLMESDVNLTLAELTHRAINIAPGRGKNKWSIRTRRNAFLDMPRELREKQVNRVLLLLRESLNDDPRRRYQQPWMFMDIENMPSIGPVPDPAKYSTHPEHSCVGQLSQKLLVNCSHAISQISHRTHAILQEAMHRYKREQRLVTRSLVVLVTSWLPALIPQNPQQQIYDQLAFEFELTLRDKETYRNDLEDFSFEPRGVGPFEHNIGDECHNINYLYSVLAPQLRNRFRGDEYQDRLYVFARLRSRVKLCCWKKYARGSLIDNQDELNARSPQEAAMEDEISRLASVISRGAFASNNFTILAWLCRGEIASEVFNAIQQDHTRLWDWLHDNSDEGYSTKAMCLLLEQGCNIGQELQLDGRRRSAFQHYLENLRVESGNLALDVCKHFRRITTNENATIWAEFYLAGHPPDVRDDEILNGKDVETTALHDAVRASNYDVVEYLVRTDFVLTVRDAAGMTALQLANHVAQDISKAESAAKHLKNNQIIALLRQNRAERPDFAGSLPLGWEEIRLGTRSVYRETSINSDADPLTFIKPREGLLQNKKLALGQRKVAASGQAYYLDPLRFLQAKSKGLGRAEIATKPTYDEDWYLREAENVAKPPSDPRSDRRLWYRFLVALYYFVEALPGHLVSRYSFALFLLVSLLVHDAWTSITMRSGLSDPKAQANHQALDHVIRSGGLDFKMETCKSFALVT